jgi:hypothetical protein
MRLCVASKLGHRRRSRIQSHALHKGPFEQVPGLKGRRRIHAWAEGYM